MCSTGSEHFAWNRFEPFSLEEDELGKWMLSNPILIVCI